MVLQRQSAMWHSRHQVPYADWTWGDCRDGLRRFEKTKLKANHEPKLLSSTRIRMARHGTRVHQVWNPRSQRLICFMHCTFSHLDFHLLRTDCWMDFPSWLSIKTHVPRENSMASHSPCSVSPRNYPRAFGKKLVSLFQELVTSKSGMPQLPDELPSGESVFSQMTFDDPWTDANVTRWQELKDSSHLAWAFAH